jgi:hypothetical protein
MLIQGHGLTESQSFDLLSEMSQRYRRKLRDVAADIASGPCRSASPVSHRQRRYPKEPSPQSRPAHAAPDQPSARTRRYQGRRQHEPAALTRRPVQKGTRGRRRERRMTGSSGSEVRSDQGE